MAWNLVRSFLKIPFPALEIVVIGCKSIHFIADFSGFGGDFLYGLYQLVHKLSDSGHELNESGHELNEPVHELNESVHELNQSGSELNESGSKLIKSVFLFFR